MWICYVIGPDGNAVYDTDPEVATLVAAKFTNISQDAIIYRYEINECKYIFSMHIYICRPRWVKVNGTTYRPGCYIVVGFEYMMPSFARVDSIVVSLF